MKVSRNDSKAPFSDLALGDKYYGPRTGKLCTKSDDTHGVRNHDGERGYVAPETVVKVPVVKGKIVQFSTLKAGQAFIRQGVADAEAYVQVKTGGGRALRLGNGQVIDVSARQNVEVLDGVYTFAGKR